MAKKKDISIFTKIGMTLAPIPTIRSAIDSWKPRGCKTEKDYENSLYHQFENKLGRAFTKQYGLKRARIDIAFEKIVGIELKMDFKSHAQYQRLLGQVELYKNEFNQLYLVICGKNVDDNLLSELKKKYRWSGNIEIIKK